MSNQMTITAKTGPNVTNTAIVLQNVTSYTHDMIARTLTVYQDGIPGFKQFDMTGITTFTVSVSSNVYTITIS